MAPPNIIALVGRARSGKDTACDVLTRHFGGVHVVVRLAAPLKAAAAELFGLEPHELEGPEKDVSSARCLGGTPREALVWLTGATRAAYGEAFFTRRLFDAFDAGLLGPHIIIPDVRSEQDAAEARRRGGLVLKLVRPPECGGTTHTFEATVDAVCSAHTTVVNDGTPEDMERRLLEAVRTVLEAGMERLPGDLWLLIARQMLRMPDCTPRDVVHFACVSRLSHSRLWGDSIMRSFMTQDVGAVARKAGNAAEGGVRHNPHHRHPSHLCVPWLCG
jgi:hypothetical protein